MCVLYQNRGKIITMSSEFILVFLGHSALWASKRSPWNFIKLRNDPKFKIKGSHDFFAVTFTKFGFMFV